MSQASSQNNTCASFLFNSKKYMNSERKQSINSLKRQKPQNTQYFKNGKQRLSFESFINMGSYLSQHKPIKKTIKNNNILMVSYDSKVQPIHINKTRKRNNFGKVNLWNSNFIKIDKRSSDNHQSVRSMKIDKIENKRIGMIKLSIRSNNQHKRIYTMGNQIDSVEQCSPWTKRWVEGEEEIQKVLL